MIIYIYREREREVKNERVVLYMVVDEDNEVSEIEMLQLLEVREENERGYCICMHTWLREKERVCE